MNKISEIQKKINESKKACLDGIIHARNERVKLRNEIDVLDNTIECLEYEQELVEKKNDALKKLCDFLEYCAENNYQGYKDTEMYNKVISFFDTTYTSTDWYASWLTEFSSYERNVRNQNGENYLGIHKN